VRAERLKRAALVSALAIVVALAAANAAVAQLVKSVEAVGMTVSDVDRSMEFFRKVLGFEEISDVEVDGKSYEKLQGLFGVRLRVARMKLGGEIIELTQYLAPEGRPIPLDWRSNDHSFQHIAIVVSDMDRAYQHLRSHKIRHASSGPQTIPGSNASAAGIRAFYFKDPDGHHLEIISFPAGKGDPRWQQSNGRLFLGIDHTAIVVANTASSLKYYRDLLGMRLAGETLNSGTEQEHLNNVAGARLRITGLRTAIGPGVEFLEYLAPRTGRPAPQDTRVNDIWHWQTVLATGNAHEAVQRIRAGGRRIVSPSVVALPDKSLGFRKGFLARDPDGHGIQFIEK
jgi:catechol 2,3-dioxygenase-like lactoylglutathione lyase family enzyme